MVHPLTPASTQGAIRTWSSRKKEEGKAWVGTEKGSHGEKALMMFRSQNKADTTSSRDGGGVGLGASRQPTQPSTRCSPGRRQAVWFKKGLPLSPWMCISVFDDAWNSLLRFRILTPSMGGNHLSCGHCLTPQCEWAVRWCDGEGGNSYLEKAR